MRAREVFVSGIILSVSAFVMRSVSVAFNVYVSDKIGAEGMGLLTLIMSVYSLALTFAVSGISLAATRLTAEAAGSGREGDIKAAMIRCLVYSATFGISAFLVVFFGADYIGGVWLGDTRSIKALRVFALSMPFISVSSAMNGYFTALRKVVKTSAAQFFEQGVRIAVTVILFTAFLKRGTEYACIAVIAGQTVAEILSFLLTVILYLYDARRICGIVPDKAEKKLLTSKMLHIALPVAFSAYIRTGLVTLEHLLIPRGLRKFGASGERSLATYGTLQGMVLPIVLFPTAFLSSFNLLLVPELAEASAKGEKRHITYIISRVMKFTMLFSLGVSAIMICFSRELGIVIYDSREAADYIRIVAPLAPIMFLDSAVDSMLKGLDEQLYNMRINIIDAASSALLVYVLCPRIGIMGYIVTIFASEIFNLSCSFVRLLNTTGFRVKVGEWFIKPLVCAVSSCVFTRALLEVSNGVSYTPPSLTLHLLLAGLMYLLLLLVTNTLGSDDCAWLKKLVKFKK